MTIAGYRIPPMFSLVFWAVVWEIVGRLADDAEGKKLLQAAQRAWISFRDAECAFSTNDSKGGSIYPMLMSNCLEELTADRTKQLRTYLDCEEGDMSCPVPPAQ